MYASQITQILRTNHQTSRIFLGCFPCNRLPNPSSSKGKMLIVNLDPFGYEGSHWVVVYIKYNNEVIYFDSLALPTSICIINSFLKNFYKISKNLKPYQSSYSNTCSQHCISFIYFFSKGYTFDQYLELLNKQANPDLFVTNIVNKMINY